VKLNVSTASKALAIAAMATLAFTSIAEARVLKVQTSQNAGDFTFEHLKNVWAPKLKTMTNGEIEIELLPTGSVVPYRETPDAVANGILDGDLTAIAYFSGRDPAFALMGDLIAGYDSPDQVATFCAVGGGTEMLQKIFDTLVKNVHVIGCDAYTREALVAKIPIKTLADLKGVKIRSPEGLAAEVFKRAGAAPVSLPFSEVYTSLEKGVVDAADASAYANNDASGMHKVAKYPIYPGIHSMAFIQFTLNQDLWDSLNDAQKTAIEVWYLASRADLRRVADLEDKDLVARDRKAGDITIVDWAQADRDAFREIAKGAWKDFSEKSELAKEAYDTHVKYMERMGLLTSGE
jgi:TRAP-type mannitol/chloroaromatic compound transport system substrate-binding protein